MQMPSIGIISVTPSSSTSSTRHRKYVDISTWENSVHLPTTTYVRISDLDDLVFVHSPIEQHFGFGLTGLQVSGRLAALEPIEDGRWGCLNQAL